MVVLRTWRKFYAWKWLRFESKNLPKKKIWLNHPNKRKISKRALNRDRLRSTECQARKTKWNFEAQLIAELKDVIKNIWFENGLSHRYVLTSTHSTTIATQNYAVQIFDTEEQYWKHHGRVLVTFLGLYGESESLISVQYA